jgi:tRNA nucleotidyltransferase/poly(A) polymerase
LDQEKPKQDQSKAREELNEAVTFDPGGFLREHAPWLFEPTLGTCIVGSSALQLACDKSKISGPQPADLDLSWGLDLATGEALLRQHDVFVDTTTANRSRGTLAMKIGGARLEITCFRGPGTADLQAGILEDLAARDMTVGALAYCLSSGEIFDPFDGLSDWTKQRVAPVGDPSDRIREHVIRWVRYYRRAHEWGFSIDPAIRKVGLDRGLVCTAPPEHLAAELRAALLNCASPGQFFMELHECGLLQEFAPELASQFDGRPAGPIRHHPEVSQALHLTLSLEWYASHSLHLSEPDRNRLGFAVLCHDLGKGLTDPEKWPAHHGHEDGGIKPLRALLERLPGLTDAAGRRLAEAVCSLHLIIRDVENLRSGTRAKLYGQYFRDKNFDANLFALAVGADSGGRLGRAEEGKTVAIRVEQSIAWLRERCEAIDAGALWQKHQGDKEAFQSELHQAWARALSQPPD